MALTEAKTKEWAVEYTMVGTVIIQANSEAECVWKFNEMSEAELAESSDNLIVEPPFLLPSEGDGS